LREFENRVLRRIFGSEREEETWGRNKLSNYIICTLHTYLIHGVGYYLKSWLSLSLSKNILLSYGTRKFITVFTKARHWTLSWASWIQFAPLIPISLSSILMLSSHPCLDHPSGILPSGLPPETL
jgi:hypothetical protein